MKTTDGRVAVGRVPSISTMKLQHCIVLSNSIYQPRRSRCSGKVMVMVQRIGPRAEVVLFGFECLLSRVEILSVCDVVERSCIHSDDDRK